MEASDSKLKPTTETSDLKPIFPHPNEEVIKTPCSPPIESALPTLLIAENIESATEPVGQVGDFVFDTDDNRIRFKNTNQWPNSVHGVISVDFNGTRDFGTGILIGPNIVLTAGHVLYDFDSKTKANLERIQFIPGINEKTLHFNPVDVEKYFVSPHYIEKRIEDFGILILKKPIGKETGYFGLACLDPEEVKSKELTVKGYPRDKVYQKKKTFELWGATSGGAKVNTAEGCIYYLTLSGRRAPKCAL